MKKNVDILQELGRDLPRRGARARGSRGKPHVKAYYGMGLKTYTDALGNEVPLPLSYGIIQRAPKLLRDVAELWRAQGMNIVVQQFTAAHAVIGAWTTTTATCCPTYSTATTPMSPESYAVYRAVPRDGGLSSGWDRGMSVRQPTASTRRRRRVARAGGERTTRCKKRAFNNTETTMYQHRITKKDVTEVHTKCTLSAGEVSYLSHGAADAAACGRAGCAFALDGGALPARAGGIHACAVWRGGDGDGDGHRAFGVDTCRLSQHEIRAEPVTPP